MTEDITYLRIKRTMESTKECFLCKLEDEIERKYIGTYLHELVMDAPSRQKIIESRGFCNHHYYKMLIVARKPGSFNGHGMALIMKSVTEKLLQDLDKQKSCYRFNFQEMLANETMCPVCIYLSDFKEIYAKSVVELLSSNKEEFSKLFKKSKGLCLPHFATLMRLTTETAQNRSQDVIETITEVEEKSLHRLNSELAEYVRRQDYRVSDKDRKAMKDVVSRSVEKLAGRRGIKFRNPPQRQKQK